MENKLKQMFDYQKFEGNERLQKVIDSTQSKFGTKLEDDDLEMINAAGSPIINNAFRNFDRNNRDR